MMTPPLSLEYLISQCRATYACVVLATYGTDEHEEATKTSLKAFQDVMKRISALEAECRGARTLLERTHGTFFGRHTLGVCDTCDFLFEGKAP